VLNLSGGEVTIILILALVILGPESPNAMRRLRKGLRSRHGQCGIRSVVSVQTLLRFAVAIAAQPAFWNRVVVGIDDQMLRVLLSLGQKRLFEHHRRAATAETGLDHDTSLLSSKSLGTTRASLSGPPCDRIGGLSAARDVPR
jgi:hypothetical protein